MKSTIRKRTYRAIYRLLNRVSPLADDCGRLCGALCCQPPGESDNPEEDFQLGIYLLPGEEKIFTKKENWLLWSYDWAEDYDFPPSWHGKVWFVRCTTPPHCRREKRPLQCRFYPLQPDLDEQDRLQMILSTEKTPYTCPLIRSKLPLQPAFLHASYTVWRHLLRDPLIHDLVAMDSARRREKNITRTVIFPPR